jgi:hypothetical protein
MGEGMRTRIDLPYGATRRAASCRSARAAQASFALTTDGNGCQSASTNLHHVILLLLL